MSMPFVVRVAPCAVTAMPPHTAYGTPADCRAPAIAWSSSTMFTPLQGPCDPSARQLAADEAVERYALLGRFHCELTVLLGRNADRDLALELLSREWLRRRLLRLHHVGDDFGN